MQHSPASGALVGLVRSGSSDSLLSIARGLDDGDVSLGSSPVRIAALRRVDSDLAAQAYKAFRVVGTDLDAKAVAESLRVAVGIRETEQLDRPHVQVSWTGPDTDGPLLVPNAVAVRDLLRECRDMGEILLVGYSLSVPKGSFMEEVIQLLADASMRRARIRVALHQDEDENNKAELLKNWDPLARRPEIYTWDPPDNHPYTKLHAKALVVDRLQMLVTSANFTFHGLESNIELGLLVRNQPLATTVHDRFDHLINSGILKLWEGTT